MFEVLYLCMNMIDKDEEQEEGRGWRKGKMLGVDGALLDLVNTCYLMVVISKINQTVNT